MPGLRVREVPLQRQRPLGRAAVVDPAPQRVEQRGHRLRVAGRGLRPLAQDPALEQQDHPPRPVVGREVEGVGDRAGELVDGHPGRAQLALERAPRLGVDLLEREAEALGVGAVPARRDEHAGARRQHLAQQLRDRVRHLRVLAPEVGEQLHAEADVALLVVGDVAHPGAERGQDVAPREVVLDEVLAGLREGGLDDDVVERHALGELGPRPVAAQLVGVAVEVLERAPEAVRQLRLDRTQPAGDVALAEPGDLVHEALEEDGVARLVDLLRGEEILLLLTGSGVDERREVVRDGVLAPEEEGVVPQRGLALVGAEDLLPLAPVLDEVELGRAPVPALPAGVQVVVGERVGGRRRHVSKATRRRAGPAAVARAPRPARAPARACRGRAG